MTTKLLEFKTNEKKSPPMAIPSIICMMLCTHTHTYIHTYHSITLPTCAKWKERKSKEKERNGWHLCTKGLLVSSEWGTN